MPSRKKVEKRDYSNEEIALKGIEYVNKKSAIKELESQCKECRKPLEDFLRASGKETESGSLIAVVPHADVSVILKHTLRMSKVMLPDAMDVLRKNGLEECIENVPVIREDVLEVMYREGKVSDKVMTELYKEKPTYAFSVELEKSATYEDGL